MLPIVITYLEHYTVCTTLYVNINSMLDLLRDPLNEVIVDWRYPFISILNSQNLGNSLGGKLGSSGL